MDNWKEVKPGVFTKPVPTRPDLKLLKERTRARWDLGDFLKVSVRQWWNKLTKR